MSAQGAAPGEFAALQAGKIINGNTANISTASVCPRCGSVAELRRCAANGGVAWQCRGCAGIVGNWIAHHDLIGIPVMSLPPWRPR